jgi:hypothetical protein
MKTYSEQLREAWGILPALASKPSAGSIPKLSLSQRIRLTNAMQALQQSIQGLQRPTKAMNNLDLTLFDGSALSIAASGEDIAVGDLVSIDGNPAPDGEYKLHEGKILVVAGGKIAEIKPASSPVAPTEAEQKALAIKAVRKHAGIKAPHVGKTEEEQKSLAIAAARQRAGLRKRTGL